MNVRRYETKDFPEIAEWGKAWGSQYSEDLFPPTGFIVPGVAAFFLYKTDSKICYLENMVANPKVSRNTRNQALNLIVEMILAEAKAQGFKVAYACTDIGQVIERAVRSGARFRPKHVLLIKDLS